MRAIRRRLTYANVVATLALFLALAGGTVYAARVAKKSVGPSQLKARAVTTAKIKANAVTTRKIRRNAVSNAKIKDGAIESLKVADRALKAEDIDLDSLPFGRVVHRAKGTSILPLITEDPTMPALIYPLGGGAFYTQGATETDTFAGAVDVGLAPSCGTPREVRATLALDPEDPLKPAAEEIVAAGSYSEADGGGPVNARVELSPVATRFEPGTATTRRLSLTVAASCAAGSGVNALFGAVNVIGTK
jgi:hypothetical protein